MTAFDPVLDPPLDAAPGPVPDPAPGRRSLRDRLCARFGGLCRLLRLSHEAGVPF